jgi:hypothetical protein
MSFGYNRIRAATKWRAWCDEEVLYDWIEDVPRKMLIMNLVNIGISPFLKRAGYVFGCKERRIAECIARYIYFGKISHEVINWDYREEDYNHYYHVLDDDAWTSFWEMNGKWGDVEDIKVQEGIRFCVWTLLDLYASPRTNEVDDMLGLNDEDSIPASREDARDPYLIDSANGYFSAI